MLIPFYIFRYEKEFRKIDGNQKQLSGLRLEYEKIAEMLDQECQSGHMKPITCGALCELSNNVVEKLASKYSNVEKEVTEVIGGKVLNYRSKEIYLEGCAFGREEGRKEGQKESIVQLVTRKYQLGDSPEKIARDLLMSEEEVEEITGENDRKSAINRLPIFRRVRMPFYFKENKNSRRRAANSEAPVAVFFIS